jgi:hypothetical protein
VIYFASTLNFFFLIFLLIVMLKAFRQLTFIYHQNIMLNSGSLLLNIIFHQQWLYNKNIAIWFDCNDFFFKIFYSTFYVNFLRKIEYELIILFSKYYNLIFKAYVQT